MMTCTGWHCSVVYTQNKETLTCMALIQYICEAAASTMGTSLSWCFRKDSWLGWLVKRPLLTIPFQQRWPRGEILWLAHSESLENILVHGPIYKCSKEVFQHQDQSIQGNFIGIYLFPPGALSIVPIALYFYMCASFYKFHCINTSYVLLNDVISFLKSIKQLISKFHHNRHIPCL